MAKGRSRKKGKRRGKGGSRSNASPSPKASTRQEQPAPAPKDRDRSGEEADAEATAAEPAQGPEADETGGTRAEEKPASEGDEGKAEGRKDRVRRGRIKQPLRRAILAVTLLSIFVLPLAQLALATERGGAAVRVGIPGPGADLAAAIPGLARLGDVLSGSVWSITVAGFEIADPLAAGLVAASGRSATLLLAAVLPLAVTLLLGRVFCGWICPARLPVELASWLRRRVGKRGLVRAPWLRWVKYGVLVAGLGLAALTGWNLVALIYPPAILVREGQYILAYGTLGWGAIFVGGAFVADLFVEGGVWCRGLCPGGALYSLAAQPALLRIRLDEERCTRCNRCVKVCPLGLDPTSEPRGECDRCGLCQRECRDDALGYRLGLPIGGGEGGGGDGRPNAA